MNSLERSSPAGASVAPILSAAAGPATAAPPRADDGAVLDTLQGSVLHRLFRVSAARPLRSGSAELRIYFIVAALYPVLAACAALGANRLTLGPDAPRLPFLADGNVAFMFLVSLPAIVVLTLKDQQTLTRALREVFADQIVVVDEAKYRALVRAWKGIFRVLNARFALPAGIVTGLVIAGLNYYAYTPARVGFWAAKDGRLLPVGVVFLACVALFYFCVTLYVARSVAIAVFLNKVVAIARIRMVPFHPDGCGGLRPVGWLGLRNQYLLTVLGLNLVLFFATSVTILRLEGVLYGLVVAACAAYLLLGPIVFMGPLLSFRRGMLQTKTELICEVAQRLRRELERIRANFASGPVTRDDEELVERLRKIAQTLEKLPVWPFDVTTLKKFLVAYSAPLASGATFTTLRQLWKVLSDYVARN